MINSDDCVPGSCPLGISKHKKLLQQLNTVHVHVLAFQENLVALDHWMTLFLGPAINFHPREDFWLLPTIRVNTITFVLSFCITHESPTTLLYKCPCLL